MRRMPSYQLTASLRTSDSSRCRAGTTTRRYLLDPEWRVRTPTAWTRPSRPTTTPTTPTRRLGPRTSRPAARSGRATSRVLPGISPRSWSAGRRRCSTRTSKGTSSGRRLPAPRRPRLDDGVGRVRRPARSPPATATAGSGAAAAVEACDRGDRDATIPGFGGGLPLYLWQAGPAEPDLVSPSQSAGGAVTRRARRRREPEPQASGLTATDGRRPPF
jgi:hypothetical protein